MKSKVGSKVGVYAVAFILFWLGVYKFTANEALSIKPLVDSSPLMHWLYALDTVQGVSNLIGAFQIFTAGLLLLHTLHGKLSFLAGLFGLLIFSMTLTFLFTTPDTFRWVSGVPVTDFFILKDLMAWGICLQLVLDNWPAKGKLEAEEAGLLE